MAIKVIVYVAFLALAAAHSEHDCVDVCIPREAFASQVSTGQPGKHGPPGPKGEPGQLSECRCEGQNIYENIISEINDLKAKYQKLQVLTEHLKLLLPNAPRAELCGVGVRYRGSLHDSALTASSSHVPNSRNQGYGPINGRLNRPGSATEIGAWLMSAPYRQGEWIQVDLGEVKSLVGIVVRMVQWPTWHITSFKIKFGNLSDNLRFIQTNNSDKVFSVSPDNDKYTFSEFPTKISARFVRIYPWSWDREPWVEFELLSC